MASGNDESTNSTKLDAIDRYERMVDVQIETLGEIDGKAVSLMGFVGTVLGVLIAGVGFLARSPGHSFAGVPISAVLAFVVTVASLLVSVGYSVITFASSSFNYGLNATVADLFLGASLDDEEYAELVLQGYADTIVENESVVEANGRRLRKAQSALLTALLAVLVSTVLYFVGSDRLVEYAFLGIICIATWRLNRYVLSGAFLVYDEQPFGKNDGSG